MDNLDIFRRSFEITLARRGQWFIYRYKSNTPAVRVRGLMGSEVGESGEYGVAQASVSRIYLPVGKIQEPQHGDTIERESDGCVFSFESLEASNQIHHVMIVNANPD